MSDDPISRREFELALRRANLTIATLRDELLQLAGQVVALTDALTEQELVDDADVINATGKNVLEIRLSDQASNDLRIAYGEPLVDKYDVESAPIPCDELMHLCEARCCKLEFALSTQDLDEGSVRWNLARPYFVLQRADGYCCHNDPQTRGCHVYASRPAPCRQFDCRNDKRIWLDYDKRIPAPADAVDDPSIDDATDRAEIEEEIRQQTVARAMEELALRASREDA